MPIGPEHVGRTYPSTAPYRVSRAKILEFVKSLGDPNPAYLADDDTPFTAPPTFAAVIAASAWGAMFDDPDLGLSLQRTVHADQRFDIERLMREGDDVTATLTITKVHNRGLTDMVTIAVKLDTVDGEHLCTATSTLLNTREAAE
ncbi:MULTISPECIES: FAS1-like dehydratase domain-containing protein [Propionibacterium]|uniref:R_hydratase_like, (R)-hydratase [(R)-specific enoyl-CoA hydratase] n=1 Tax=Propionibacterium freudenreichii subsp. freudenreichii TaxID=66712 RepID=A0A0B7NZ50_PROFF|nr:MaoC family dehydratase N-terminal domain-containing protein [Propionibacterium freudenreichii]AJQ90234.1 UPF0336 protein [Propionibacterium freudenreichii subsp. freudenreichii]MCT2980128.1 MaoC family dehydratase [Propionibacterium freudenreichii]MCT2990791.1 MaoC family dehydratase [Propionibacterium freudenreichii]MCT2992857.1 MaoC family dehydratase [Propionibacterium freudenreichii]MCT2996618.1 MaoC family dehydratase [Propionibacterium freudenreichii]